MSDAYETRNKINKAALDLFAEKGVEATTTKDIARTAGIAEGTIYRHYVSKDDLVWDLFSTNYVGFAAKLDELAAEHTGLKYKLLVVIRHFCELFDNDPAIRDLIVEAIDNGEIPKQDVDLGTAFVLGSVMQPTTFNIYGRLTGPMIDRVPAITQAAYQALGGK